MKPDYKNWVPKSMVYGLAGVTVSYGSIIGIDYFRYLSMIPQKSNVAK